MGVPVVDLHPMSASFYEALGPERSRLAFSDGGRDGTHHNNYGAYVLAQSVVEGVRRLNLPLARHVLPEVKAFDPARPLPPETFTLPRSLADSQSARPDPDSGGAAQTAGPGPAESAPWVDREKPNVIARTFPASQDIRNM